jgi:hypothetical protein
MGVRRCRSRIDLALLLAGVAACLSLMVLLWLSVRQCCSSSCCCGARLDSDSEDEESSDGAYAGLLSADDEEAPSSDTGEGRRHVESDGEDEDDVSAGAGSASGDRYEDADWETHANGASETYATGAARPVDRDLRLEPAASEPATLSPPVMNVDADDSPTDLSSKRPARGAVTAATLDHLRTVMKAEETWRHRAESAEGGQIIDPVRAAELAEASLRERLESEGVDQMSEAPAAIKAVDHELAAEGFRRRAEDAERALRAR